MPELAYIVVKNLRYCPELEINETPSNKYTIDKTGFRVYNNRIKNMVQPLSMIERLFYTDTAIINDNYIILDIQGNSLHIKLTFEILDKVQFMSGLAKFKLLED